MMGFLVKHRPGMTDQAISIRAVTDRFRSQRISFGIEERSSLRKLHVCGNRVISRTGALFAMCSA